jgi:hypothetical protein
MTYSIESDYEFSDCAGEQIGAFERHVMMRAGNHGRVHEWV